MNKEIGEIKNLLRKLDESKAMKEKEYIAKNNEKLRKPLNYYYVLISSS